MYLNYLKNEDVSLVYWVLIKNGDNRKMFDCDSCFSDDFEMDRRINKKDVKDSP